MLWFSTNYDFPVFVFNRSKHTLSKQTLETVADTNAVDVEVIDEK